MRGLSEDSIDAYGPQEMTIKENIIAPDGLAAWIYENKPTIGSHLKITIEKYNISQ